MRSFGLYVVHVLCSGRAGLLRCQILCLVRGVLEHLEFPELDYHLLRFMERFEGVSAGRNDTVYFGDRAQETGRSLRGWLCSGASVMTWSETVALWGISGGRTKNYMMQILRSGCTRRCWCQVVFTWERLPCART